MNSMLSFFRSSTSKDSNKAEESSPFSDEDIRDLFDRLKTTSTSQDEPDILRSTDNDGFVQRAGLSRSLQHHISTDSGRIEVSSIAQSLSVPIPALDHMLREEDVLLTVQRTKILSQSEQKRLVDELEGQARKAFVDVDRFCAKEDIEYSTLARLEKGVVQRHDLIAGEYFATPGFLEQARTQLTDTARRSEAEKRSHTWQASDCLGLSTQAFSVLLKSVLSSAHVDGDIDIDKATITFVPDSYVKSTRDQRVTDLHNGAIPSMSLKEFSAIIPHDAHDDLTYSLGGYVISRKYVHRLVSDATQRALHDGYTNLKEALVEVPMETKSAIIGEIQGEAKHEPLRDGLVFMDEYIISPSWLDEQRNGVRKMAVDLAQAAWTDDSFTKLKGSILKSKLQDLAQKALKIESPLFESLWKNSATGLLNEANDSFSEKLSTLDEACALEFKEYWSSRVVYKYSLYLSGISNLADPQLKTQLEDLLRTHLVVDLIPSVSARAKSKSLTRCSQLKQGARITKLHNQLQEAASLLTVVEVLKAFEAKLSISGAVPVAAKQTLLQDLVKTMRKDKDAARLYLTLVITLVASKFDGVVYATGKFAPKLMKQVRGSLEPTLSARLEQLKDGVKAGNITDVEREEMRSTAANVVQQYQSENPSESS